MATKKFFDVLIIGTGVAGLSLAARINPAFKIALICKDKFQEGSSLYAQGGVAAVMDINDSIEAHIQDTLIAGAGLCDYLAVKFTVENAKESIEWLIKQGVCFDKVEDTTIGNCNFHLTREGGHSHRRILHAADATGKAVTTTLGNYVRGLSNVEIFEHFVAIDLLIDKSNNKNKCVGIYAFNKNTNVVTTFHAKQTVLATGGASKVYLYSSNPDVSSGDGIAMAFRSGAKIANMEFNQFHPTCLFNPNARNFLISEALRGEGAYLRLPSGERFMHKFHQDKELAPRDIVARAIDHEMKRLGIPYVLLDISHKKENFIKKHFPNIYTECLKLDLDICKDPIPVVPAAHYTCGGVMTNQYGETNIPNLYAIGETAYTGLHGANRMASNSLLECLVFAASASRKINEICTQLEMPIAMADWDESEVTDSDEEIVVSHNWNELRNFMWDYVGIVRSNKRLARAQRRVDLLKQEVEEYYSKFKINNNLIELRNLVDIAYLIVCSAISRKESRGLHYNLDYPESNPELSNVITILSK